jgi:ATP-dependent DNA helicase RecG
VFLRELTGPLSGVRGVGRSLADILSRAGITTIAELLSYYPRDWEDRGFAVPLVDFRRYPAVNTVVRVLAHDWFGFGRMKTLKIYIEDESARAALVCFNRPFLEKQLVAGKYYRLWGKFFYKYGEIQSSAFETELLPEGAARPDGSPVRSGAFSPGAGGGSILPVYRLTAGLSQNVLRRIMKNALDAYAASIDDELPAPLAARDGFLPRSEAVRAIHFPKTMAELAEARRLLIYEELFYLEILVGKRALERRRPPASPAQGPSPGGDGGAALSPLQERLLERLPFALTAGQRGAVQEINADMAGQWPMARLLQGDVGAGKTLVSFLAALRAVEETPRGQAAIMAPTELLARQHAENAARLLEPLGIRIAFLTGNLNARGRARLLAALAAGDIDVVVGTHALFSRGTVYRNLRLVVVDEQHRFGVTQRQAILDKGDHPHLLMMSATPIPRTLAFTVFGDMDVSVIPDLPPGRKPVKTHLARESSEERVYDFVRKELAAGRQAYFVYPLIGDDPAGASQDDEAAVAGGVKAAAAMAGRLAKEVFPSWPVTLVHARLDEEEKRARMEAFRRGTVRVLVATSVVEVGVDVPNATCMVIEHAGRFGLAALHQLRGRVGRGDAQSYCFLVYEDGETGEGSAGALSGDAKKRLMVMLEHNDGFVIAEEDLKLRGPGQIAGTEQSGYLSLGLADPVRDAACLARAREDAFSLLASDPPLLLPEHQRVREVLARAAPFSDVSL